MKKLDRPKIEDYIIKDPQITELFDGELPDLISYAKANKKYIDYLEAKINNDVDLDIVRQQSELLKAFLIWFDGDLKLIDHKELIEEYFESLK